MVGNDLDFNNKKYQNLVLLGDLNITKIEDETNNFLEHYNPSNLVNFPTCSKNIVNPRDLIITNKPSSFQNTTGIYTGLLDF